MAMTMILFLYTYLFLVFGFPTTLKPLLDKSEIGDGETFTVTCDFSRVINDTLSPWPIFELAILRKLLSSTGSDFEFLMCSLPEYIYPKPEENTWPWKPTFHFRNVNKTEDKYIFIHNTNSVCDDAGEYKCYIEFDKDDWIYPRYHTQLLRKKASCGSISTSAMPNETTYSSAIEADSTAYSEPTTQSTSGIQVTGSGKSFFIARFLLYILVTVM